MFCEGGGCEYINVLIIYKGWGSYDPTPFFVKLIQKYHFGGENMLTLSGAVGKLREENLIDTKLKNFKYDGKRAMFSCPFHHDVHPSANLFEWNGSVIFHCFGCNKTMSFERFLKELTGKESKEKKLSDGYKFDLTEFAEGLHGRFLLLLEGGKDWRFDDEPKLAQEAYKYLQSRGFDLEDIKRYKIGFFYGRLR